MYQKDSNGKELVNKYCLTELEFNKEMILIDLQKPPENMSVEQANIAVNDDLRKCTWIY